MLASWLAVALAAAAAAQPSDLTGLLQTQFSHDAVCEKHRLHHPFLNAVPLPPRRPWLKNGRLLLFWAVGSQPDAMELVRANIEHVRGQQGLAADIYLVHYDGGRKGWLQHFGGEWYHSRVTFSSEAPGFKFLLARQLLMRQGAQANASDYEWLWFLDEDIDLQRMDLARLLAEARASGAVIVGPSIVQSKDEEGVQLGRRSASLCHSHHKSCKVQAPHTQCRFRRTTFVEVMAPLLAPRAFEVTAGTCAHCMQKRSVWGLDQVWCGMAAEDARMNHTKACALLDQVHVGHRDLRTLPKYDRGLEEKRMHENRCAKHQVLAKLSRYAATELRWSCEPLH